MCAHLVFVEETEEPLVVGLDEQLHLLDREPIVLVLVVRMEARYARIRVRPRNHHHHHHPKMKKKKKATTLKMGGGWWWRYP
jgi:hypothetical protein